MKSIRKIFGLIVLSGLCFYSCETTDMDLTEDPNYLTPEQANVDFYLNAIERSYVSLMQNFGNYGAQVTRIEYLGSRNYLNAYAPTSFDDEWDLAYRQILADVEAMTPIAQENEQFHHIAIAQLLSANVLITLVDFFGDIPYSEALMADEGNFNPNLDNGAAVYSAATQLIDTAITNFNKEAALEPEYDPFYNGNYENWIKLANTLKMKIYLQTRLVDNSALSSFNQIVASGDFITSTDEDFQFNYGTNENQPDTRNGNYAGNYRPTGAGSYLSNWLMGTMLEDGDPRIRYYFYRQVNAVPGEEIEPNEQTLTCSMENAPQHYIDGGFTFCSLPNGYWGRDHGDDDGTPGDGFLRTTYGIYPAGGMFDDSRFAPVSQGAGAAGAGITPLMLASWVDFMRAEMAMVEGDVAAAQEFVVSGTAKSITKVRSFGALDEDADLSLAPSEEQMNSFLSGIETAFIEADTEEKWNLLAEEFWISCFGNGILNYNFYRRTGYPTTLQPNREPNPGGFIRSFRYPANLVNNNSSISQKQEVTTTVFWDTNPASPSFPESN